LGTIGATLLMDDYPKYIKELDYELERKFSSVIQIDEKLTRQLVSFQANKKNAFHKWFKYKEGFSADLVKYFFHQYKIIEGPILDPFAGIGTTLFVSSELGLESIGIELLPSSVEIIKSRKTLLFDLKDEEIEFIKEWKSKKIWNNNEGNKDLVFFRITEGAYPKSTKTKIESYLFEVGKISISNVKTLLFFALLSILETISYTRKDGQYLRWDYRSGRKAGKIPFDKGKILDFDDAIIQKIEEIIEDFYFYKSGSLFERKFTDMSIISGSSLNLLPTFDSNYFNSIMTSPPYCNRYDYTRTYALELALMEITQNDLNQLRQTLLSCTVENKEKNLISIKSSWEKPIQIAQNQLLLSTILNYLEYQKKLKKLNNDGIVRMVRGYFYELACIIYESYRVLKPGGYLFMVNDNVRYAGISISVDLILSDLAKSIGFNIDNILVLPKGKGNSSQQMGEHGREELRKSIYVWRK
jgi:DNA modification methylase